MRANALIPVLSLLCSAAAVPAFAQEQVVINDQVVTAEQIAALQARLGIPEDAQVQIPPGRYWYDRVSGLWAYERNQLTASFYLRKA